MLGGIEVALSHNKKVLRLNLLVNWAELACFSCVFKGFIWVI